MPVVAGIGEAAGVAASVAVSDEVLRQSTGGIKGDDSFRDTENPEKRALLRAEIDFCYLVIVADLTNSPSAERILIQYIPLLSAALTLIRCLPAGINPFTGASTVFPVIS